MEAAEAVPYRSVNRLSDTLRKHPPVARNRRGRILSDDISTVLLPGSRLAPAQRRVLRVLMSEEGRFFGFQELADLAWAGTLKASGLERANLIHRHVHYIRQALVGCCWVESILGSGFVFRKRE